MVDLNDLLPPGSGWLLTAANAINAAGQITGVGTSPKGELHAFLLNPVTSPTRYRQAGGENLWGEEDLHDEGEAHDQGQGDRAGDERDLPHRQQAGEAG